MIFSRTAVALASDDDGRPSSMVFVDCDVSFGAGDFIAFNFSISVFNSFTTICMFSIVVS